MRVRLLEPLIALSTSMFLERMLEYHRRWWERVRGKGYVQGVRARGTGKGYGQGVWARGTGKGPRGGRGVAEGPGGEGSGEREALCVSGARLACISESPMRSLISRFGGRSFSTSALRRRRRKGRRILWSWVRTSEGSLEELSPPLPPTLPAGPMLNHASNVSESGRVRGW